MSSRPGIEPTTENSKDDPTTKNKGKQPKHTETHSERLKARIEKNKTKDTTHRRVTKTRDLSVHEEPVSLGIISHPFSFVILTSLGPQALFFWKSPFPHFFSQRISLYSSISHFSIPPLGGWWINSKLKALASSTQLDSSFFRSQLVNSSHRGVALQLGVRQIYNWHRLTMLCWGVWMWSDLSRWGSGISWSIPVRASHLAWYLVA